MSNVLANHGGALVWATGQGGARRSMEAESLLEAARKLTFKPEEFKV